MANEVKEELYTTYAVAVNWLHNEYVLCNNVVNIDEGIYEQIPYDEDKDEYEEIFQYYITDASEGDVEYLKNAFGLKFAYSDVLDNYILLVDHYGTNWNYVSCKVNTEFEYAPKESALRSREVKDK